MLLYHGTGGAIGERIIKEGILPRGSRANRWSSDRASHADCVYLSARHGFSYALRAEDEGGICLVEIDSAEHEIDLVPDEDYLGLTDHSRNWEDHKASLVDYLDTQVWRESIRRIGTCACFGPIYPENILRSAICRNFRNCPVLSILCGCMGSTLFNALLPEYHQEPLRQKMILREPVEAIELARRDLTISLADEIDTFWGGCEKRFAAHVDAVRAEIESLDIEVWVRPEEWSP